MRRSGTDRDIDLNEAIKAPDINARVNEKPSMVNENANMNMNMNMNMGMTTKTNAGKASVKKQDNKGERANQAAPDMPHAFPHDYKVDFPGLNEGWHYLDNAATTQKPKPVLDRIAAIYAQEYATVHRGVYDRSAQATIKYEAAREAVARFINAAHAKEVIFTSGATDAINLVAQSWGRTYLSTGDRIMLSIAEHHSNIVPWQLLAQEKGLAIDFAPLTSDHQIDLDALESMMSDAHKLVALTHISNVTGAVLNTARARAIAHKFGAKLLLDGCQAAPRLTLDMQAIDADFYVFSGHKLYGPTGIGVLWAPYDLLESLPPWRGGGSMIDKVSVDGFTYAPPPGRFEAGTPHIAGAIGLHAAIHYLENIGMDNIASHENRLVRMARCGLAHHNDIRFFGPEESAGILSFAIDGVHPHDIATILDEDGVAIRAGHHCAQTLMENLKETATARASFGLYSDEKDVQALIIGIDKVKRIFG